jgi:hypothetical protein
MRQAAIVSRAVPYGRVDDLERSGRMAGVPSEAPPLRHAVRQQCAYFSLGTPSPNLPWSTQEFSGHRRNRHTLISQVDDGLLAGRHTLGRTK